MYGQVQRTVIAGMPAFCAGVLACYAASTTLGDGAAAALAVAAMLSCSWRIGCSVHDLGATLVAAWRR